VNIEVNPNTLVVIAGLLFCASVALADDPQPTTGPATRAPDKDQYTLFNPTPPDQMRGMDMDRPDKTNTPHTIDAGHVQIETGFFDYVYYRNRYQGADSRTDSVNFGQFDFRLGLLNNLEFNAVVDSYAYYQTKDYAANQTVRQNGFGDTTIGGKLNLWGNDTGDQTGATALAIQPQLKIPTAREAIGNGHPELFVIIPFSYNAAPNLQVNFQSTPSWERSTDNTSYVAGWAQTAEIDYSFTDKFDMYLEYWAHVTTERHQEAQQTLDIGAKYALTNNLVLDTALDFGLNKASPNIEWVAGVSFRF
jgi:hypothetical protein